MVKAAGHIHAVDCLAACHTFRRSQSRPTDQSRCRMYARESGGVSGAKAMLSADRFGLNALDVLSSVHLEQLFGGCGFASVDYFHIFGI
jgi:hypothetical protein